MGLARKGSRRINVGGHDYRWVVSPDSGFLVIVAESYDVPGQRMEAQVGYDERDGRAREITPSVVRRAIELALRDGWQPGASGKPAFRLVDADERVWGEPGT